MGSAVNVVVLGATGRLGNAVFRGLSKAPDADVMGTIRREAARALFAPEHASRLTLVEDIENPQLLAQLLQTTAPDVVVNCIAVGRPGPVDPMRSIAVY